MELPPEYTANMPDGSHFTYFDTGAPGPEPYTTYLLVHGLAYNKWTWKNMITTKPDSARLVGFNLRGYSRSSPFPPNLQKYEVGPIIGNDFINMLDYVVHELGMEIALITIIAWSLAAASLIAAYGSLVQPDGSISQQDWPGYIQNIVFYEPAGTRGFGLELWTASGRTLPPPEDPIEQIGRFRRLAANYYGYDEAFYARPCLTGEHDPADTCAITGCLIETDHQAWVELERDVLERGPFFTYASLRYCPNKPDMTEEQTAKYFARQALVAMAGTDVEKIHAISTRNTLPGCTIGAQYFDAVISAEAPGKSRLKWIMGEYNHFVHNIAPNLLWTTIIESVGP